jgi:hypothetical protein
MDPNIALSERRQVEEAMLWCLGACRSLHVERYAAVVRHVFSNAKSLIPGRNFPTMGAVGAMEPGPFVLRPD